jgi:hypothetical protein
MNDRCDAYVSHVRYPHAGFRRDPVGHARMEVERVETCLRIHRGGYQVVSQVWLSFSGLHITRGAYGSLNHTWWCWCAQEMYQERGLWGSGSSMGDHLVSPRPVPSHDIKILYLTIDYHDPQPIV